MSVIVCVVRCAAVLFIDGAVFYTDGVPNDEILDKFQNRNDRCVGSCCADCVDLVWHQADYHSRNLSDFGWLINIPEATAGPEGCCLVRQQGSRRGISQRKRKSF